MVPLPQAGGAPVLEDLVERAADFLGDADVLGVGLRRKVDPLPEARRHAADGGDQPADLGDETCLHFAEEGVGVFAHPRFDCVAVSARCFGESL